MRASRCQGRRGFGRVAPVLVLAVILLAAISASACGDRSSEAASVRAEKDSDAAILNASRARELTLLDAYAAGRPLMRGGFRALGREFRAQQQEYVNAVTKSIRGVGGDVEERPEPIDLGEVGDQAELLAVLHELESAALASYVEASSRLYTSAPRTLATSLAAAHAQHLVLIRQAMGASAVESVPEAFDGGRIEPVAASRDAATAAAGKD